MSSTKVVLIALEVPPVIVSPSTNLLKLPSPISVTILLSSPSSLKT